MKKFIILFFLMVTFASIADAQTYKYRHISNVDESGVKSKGSGTVIFVTFVDSKRLCYMSDTNGNAKSNGAGAQQVFVTTKNNVHVYKSKAEVWRDQGVTSNPFMSDPTKAAAIAWRESSGYENYKFSSDYSRLNIATRGGNSGNSTKVYERVTSDVSEEDSEMY